ncbi:unnamed protein product [Bursaphelenchus okinawaensis]|uniref:Uncharacterized protein n=1 Tax=Bursaphelenchus okinawaensis TaxID=465554 RepID=A0A811KEH6_9BILA|nr:unnamed protein product [Bursaphelenchus okinawaensis]CAG9102362.1 unnamed protein product [Bursaphelenchus okinawaensis]
MLLELTAHKQFKAYSIMNGTRCAWDIPGWNDTKNRAHSYIMGKYISLSPGKAVRWGSVSCNDKVLNVVDITDIPDSELPPSIKEIEKECWKMDVDDKYCVDNLDSDDTILVPRRNPIYYTLSVTVYRFCCGGGYECEGDGGNRCSYFIYDHETGVDFYIDDQVEWTSDKHKRPVYLIPTITVDDQFTNKTKHNVTTPRPPVTVTASPPSGCYSNFWFYFKGWF